MANTLSDEEVAARIVDIYFTEVARLGFKRSLKLDEVINAYYYVLSKLKDKECALKEAMEKVIKEEEELKTETKEELIPSAEEAEETEGPAVEEEPEGETDANEEAPEIKETEEESEEEQ